MVGVFACHCAGLPCRATLSATDLDSDRAVWRVGASGKLGVGGWKLEVGGWEAELSPRFRFPSSQFSDACSIPDSNGAGGWVHRSAAELPRVCNRDLQR